MTYSIVALDSESGLVGVAVASGSIAVGSRVPWAKNAVGAVATQAYTNPALGPLILSYMEEGFTSEEALTKALGTDDSPNMRQVAVISVKGDKAVHNGNNVPKECGYCMGEHCVCIANLVKSSDIPKLMCHKFEELMGEGNLARALLEALKEGHEAGGDKRGDRSAALLVVGPTPYGELYDRLIDLRVDYSPDPVGSLEKLLRLTMKA
ncbi:MAG: DUF1028 domain-containing protein [Thermoprotei archaeon]|nr:DUF1028 domain-containing protein [Thermoprotei archaeon]